MGFDMTDSAAKQGYTTRDNFNILRPEQNGCQSADYISKFYFLYETVVIFI